MTLHFTPAEILEAFTLYGRHPKQAQLDALVHRSKIPIMALAGEHGDVGIRFAAIDRLADGSFDFAEGEGEPAMVVLARGWLGDVADIIAAKPDGYLGAWLGAVSVLGLHNVLAPRLLNPRLAVHASVFDWLRDDRRGVVLVNETRAARELRDYGPFWAPDVEHGLRWRDLLIGPMPSITVPEPLEERRAA